MNTKHFYRLSRRILLSGAVLTLALALYANGDVVMSLPLFTLSLPFVITQLIGMCFALTSKRL